MLPVHLLCVLLCLGAPKGGGAKWGHGGGTDLKLDPKPVIPFGREHDFWNIQITVFKEVLTKTATCISQNANPSKIEEAKSQKSSKSGKVHRKICVTWPSVAELF